MINPQVTISVTDQGVKRTLFPFPGVEWWSYSRAVRVMNRMAFNYAKARDWEMVAAIHEDMAATLEGRV